MGRTHELFSVKQSALKMCIHVKVYGLNWLDLGIQMYIHKCIQQQLVGKRSQKFEGDWGGINGKVWRVVYYNIKN